jgi:hypothetical protein
LWVSWLEIISHNYRSFSSSSSSSSSSVIFFFRDEELGWMDDGTDDETDDGTDGWKGRPPPSQPDKTKDIIL